MKALGPSILFYCYYHYLIVKDDGTKWIHAVLVE